MLCENAWLHSPLTFSSHVTVNEIITVSMRASATSQLFAARSV